MLQLSQFDQRCRDLVDMAPKCRSRHCMRSALHHLECATKIFEIDPGMTAFRCITAVEEAASGLMHCLKEGGYQNSDRLDPQKHLHKNAILPFFDVLGLFFAETTAAHIKKPSLSFHGEGSDQKLELSIMLPIDGEMRWVTPIPPLSFKISSEEKRLSYRPQIESLAAFRGVNRISEYLKEQANFRNQILYAGPDGYPGQIDLAPDFLEIHQIKVFALIRAYLLIYPHRELQGFVQDSLDAFLAMIGNLKEHDLHGTA